jgi:DNA-binding transcriptional LysR family regulator
MLDARRMQVLRAVVDTGSVTAAATQLGYTPSAVSQQVATLEREAGTALLERAGRGVRPTAAGRLLTSYAQTIAGQLVEAETALADLRAGRTGRLSVHYFASAGAALLAPALTRLRHAHPGVAVGLTLSGADDPLPEVRQGRADMALVVLPPDRPDPGARGEHRAGGPDGVRLEHLLDDPYRAVLPRGHRLARRRGLDLSDLAGEPWVESEPPGPCRETVARSCAAAGFAPAAAVESADYATARGFVAAGLGVSLIPRLGLDALGGTDADVVVRELRRPEPVRAIHAAVRLSPNPHAALSALLSALRATAALQAPARHRPDTPDLGSV